MTVRQSHRDEYEEVGCVRIEGVFSDYWVDKVRTGADRVLKHFQAGRTPEPAFQHPGNLNPTFYEQPGSVQMNGIAGCAEEFREWIEQSPAAETVAALTGANHVSFWVDAFFLKEGDPEGQGTPWHNDECTYGFEGEQIPSLWMALTDVDDNNAPLMTLAGSNHDPWRYHSPFSPQDVERPAGFRPWQELLDRVAEDNADIQVWPVNAGDALVIHPKTIHGSGVRRPGARSPVRAAYSSRWLGSDAVWRPNPLSLLLPNIPDGVLTEGEPPPEQYFPRVWSR